MDAQGNFVYAPRQVFSYVGHIEDTDQQFRGFAIAASPRAVIDAMRECGFVLTALLSLEDLQQVIEILQAIQSGDAEAVTAGDLLVTDRMQTATRSWQIAMDQVFTFTGHVKPIGELSTGFAVAADPEDLVTYLSTFSFQVASASTLQDLQSLQEDLEAVAEARHDESSCLDLLTEAAEAA